MEASRLRGEGDKTGVLVRAMLYYRRDVRVTLSQACIHPVFGKMFSTLVCILAVGGMASALVAQHQTDGSENRQEGWSWKGPDAVKRTRAELDEILEQHEQWVYSDGKLGSRANLSNTFLEHVNLHNANLNNADLSGADLSGADLSNAKLTQANLTGARLVKADLSGARAEFAMFGGADLTGARLRDADVSRANLVGARARNADFKGADLFYSRPGGADFRDADLAGANIDRAVFRGADLRGCDLDAAKGKPILDRAKF